MPAESILERVELCCPACRADLEESKHPAHELRCTACKRQYPVIAGIPDLRLYPDPYLDIESDRAKGIMLAERFADFDFAGFVNFYYANTSVVTAAQAREFTNGLIAAQSRAADALGSWQAAAGQSASKSALLDLGCGTGPMLVAAANKFDTMIGVDIAFRWLVVARKRLADAGVDAPLICACAEALPFRDQSFGTVTAESVIEHVRDQPKALAEVYRLLRDGGHIFMATPNRFSLGPDPHLGVWGGSLMPQRWVAAFARRKGAVPPHRKLVSAMGLQKLLRGAGFSRRRLLLPDIPAARRAQLSSVMRGAVNGYQLAKRLPVTRELLYFSGPLLSAVATRQPAR